MPVGIALGGAAIGAAGSIYGASKSSSAAKKAANLQAQSAADQTALQREIYGQNKEILSPFASRGNAAGESINALLGLPGAPAAQPAAGALSYDPGSYIDGVGYIPNYAPQPAAPAQPAASPAQTAMSAYEAFKQSTGYQTRLNEGMRALNSGYAAHGTLQSGAAVKSALRYGQDYASNEFGNYMGYLGNQQGVGLSAGSALAGVGQGFANSMGQISQNNATAQGQAAGLQAQSANSLAYGLTGAANQALGALSSYSNPTINGVNGAQYAATLPGMINSWTTPSNILQYGR